MNNYELLYIIDNQLADEAKEALIVKFSTVIADNGGSVENVDKWGTKKLAYEINDKTDGFFVLVNFNAPSSLPIELERVLGITDGVIRYLVIRK